mgnify:CR=1 FL=1
MVVKDDACHPGPDSVEILLGKAEGPWKVRGYDVPCACSLVKFSDGSLREMNNPITTRDWPRAYLTGLTSMLITECTFVSVLVPRWAIAEHGLPLGEYFIWFDDKEFTKRLLRQYGAGIIAMDSIVIHDMGVNAGVNYRHVDETNIWKFEKGTRNQASYRIRNEGRLSFALYFLRVYREMRAGGVANPVKKRMYQALKTARTFNPRPRFPDNPKYRR